MLKFEKMQILKIGKVLWSHDYEMASLGLINEDGALFSFTPPPHHSNGEIILTGNSLVIDGDSFLNIPLDKLEQMYLGFDDVYKRSMVKFYGIFWSPLRLRYKFRDETHTVYLIIDHSVFGTAKNQLWFDTLKQLLSD